MPAKTNEQKRETLELRKLELEVAGLQFNAEKAIAEYERDAATADAARIYPFVGPVADSNVQRTINVVTEWFRADPAAPIEVVFNSPGGSIFAGLALFDYLRLIRDAGCPVTTTAVGYAASMAGILLQAGTTRAMTSNSWLMIHEASSDVWGKMSELRDQVTLVDKLQSQTLEILAERSTMSSKQIKAKTARYDWWLTADEALKLGFVDEVR